MRSAPGLVLGVGEPFGVPGGGRFAERCPADVRGAVLDAVAVPEIASIKLP